jgi:DNA topoisomerase III
MITTSVRGHLASQDFNTAEYGWSKCDPVVLFDAPIQTQYKDDMEPLERMLGDLAQTVQVVILWLDCDREGEAIGDEVRTACLAGNPRLRNTIYRAKFSTVMPAEIQRALHTLGRLNENFVHAVQARSELDLRVGAAFTRFQTLRLQRKFDSFSDGGVISYGPCQFPTLGFVVERWARIETFVPQDFWYIDLSLRVDSNDSYSNDNVDDTGASRGHGHNINNSTAASRPINFQWKRQRLYDQVMTAYLYESCLDVGEAIVTQLQGRSKNKWRPVPLATVELQKRASRYLRIGAETLMSAADELYQQGYISYPRTETEKFRPEFQHRPLIEQFSNTPGSTFGDYANKLLTGNNFQMPRAGQNDDQAHPPITPCKAVNPNSIPDATQRSVYTLIVKHYLACCSRDAIGKETTLTVQQGTEEFNAKGLMILERNWLEIYEPWERWSTGQGELPPLEVGSRIRPSSLVMKDGRTVPPQPLSEVELITLMDRNGIGTDATIAQHLASIQDREYARKDANTKFHPTKLGIALIEAYNSMGYTLNKPDLRRETETECNYVAAGRKTKDEIVSYLLAKMKQCYESCTSEAHKLDAAVARHFPRLGANNTTTHVVQAQFSECGSCGGPMALKQERQGDGGGGRASANNNNSNGPRRKMVYCGTCQTGMALPRGNCRPKTENETGGLPIKCPICNFQVIQILRGDGYEGNGYQVCPKCFSDPPVDHGGSANGGEFRCFMCQHPTCTLASGTAGGDVEVFACPFCSSTSGGQVGLKRNSRGFVLGCNKYGQVRCPFTIWLPKECQTVTVPSNDENSNDEICRRCSTANQVVRKINMVWKPGSVPPHLGRNCVTCLLCDTGLRQEMGIAMPQRNQAIARPLPQQRQRPGRGGRSSGGRGGRGNSGGNSCYKCGQSGHFANQCPNG